MYVYTGKHNKIHNYHIAVNGLANLLLQVFGKWIDSATEVAIYTYVYVSYFSLVNHGRFAKFTKLFPCQTSWYTVKHFVCFSSALLLCAHVSHPPTYIIIITNPGKQTGQGKHSNLVLQTCIFHYITT